MKRFAHWSRDADAPIDYQALKARLDFLADRLFLDYEPTRARGPQFSDRLIHWLDCAGDEDDQRLMFELAGYLYFVGMMEMEILYQEVFRGPITWWLIDTFEIDITDPSLEELLAQALTKTWFCPITDSMQIARFHHINGVEGKNLRPDWHTLAKLGDPDRIATYARDQCLERLVLMEDFVGTGNQASAAIEFACGALPDTPILVSPLLVCPDGNVRLGKIADKYGDDRLRFAPVVVLSQDCILSPDPHPKEPPRFVPMRQMLERLRPLVGAPERDDDRETIFGYGPTGALTVMYTNCPNNVPPLIHYSSPRWKPLFRRTIRK